MLDQNIIAQLSQLKDNIVASKEYGEGTVVGATNGRYGFVKMANGQNAFLNPEKMQRVLPGDKVKISVTKNDKDQLEGHLEELIEAPLKKFIGRYKIKGNTHFVEPNIPNFNRWLFVPPKSRLKCQADELVLAELSAHPFKDGKAATNIVTHIGKADSPYVHHNTVIAEYDLSRRWSKDATKQVEEVYNQVSAELDKLTDLTDIQFVTVDSAATRDMDDAVFCQQTDDGWALTVAIANPAAFLSPNSPIAKQARLHAQSVYLPGKPLSMLPERLATETFSLAENEAKPALVCKLTITADGAISSHAFESAKIISKHKLSYQDVSAFLDGDSDVLSHCGADVQQSLKDLSAFAKCRLAYRQQNHLVYEDQPDYDFQLDKQGLIENIVKRERNQAHKLIEEAMLATNISAGAFLAEHGCGLFSVHEGIRHDRLGEAKALLREELGDAYTTDNIDQLDGFLALMKKLQLDDQHRALIPPIKRMMANAELDTTPKPHLNMGLAHYATVTSPIRRFTDLTNHWTIQQIISGKKAQTVPAPALEKLKETSGRIRQAYRQLELTLVGHYLKSRVGLQGTGCIRIVTQHGFGVKLTDTGIEGFVQFPKGQEKRFDAKRMTLTVNDVKYALDDEVAVKVTAVDLNKRRVKMALAETPTASTETTAETPLEKAAEPDA